MGGALGNGLAKIVALEDHPRSTSPILQQSNPKAAKARLEHLGGALGERQDLDVLGAEDLLVHEELPNALLD